VLNQEIKNILNHSKKHGWVLEPDAKRLLRFAGIKVPKFFRAHTVDDAFDFAHKNNYPLVAKVVSYDVVHKSDVGGVILGITDDAALNQAFERLSAIKGFCGMLVEESLSGLELIVGAKVDYASMIKGLKAHQLLEGYRGAEPVNLEQLVHLLTTFSELVMQIESYIESIDLNPVMCTAEHCLVADARIILKG
jgi:acyl-CoA synthetase (NDP forming)